jgi:alpha-tubulin suppressor-like RCC1 family protein
MKKLLIILLLLPVIAFGQAQEDSVTVSPGEYTCLGLRHDSAFDFTSGKPVFIIAGVKKICAGSHSYLLIMLDGSVKGWGPNDAGELGLGNTSPASTPTTATIDNLGNPLPVMVDGGMSANLNAPYWQSWMISAAGDLYIAGCTLGGGSGDNTTGSSTTTRFTKVVFPGGATIVKAQTGRFMMAMDNIGRVWTWGGYNDVYVLAQGASPVNYKVPTQISFGGETATDIAGGSNTNYIITTAHHYWSWTYANQTDYNATGTFSGGTFTPGANPTVPENITTTLNFPTTIWKIAVNNESSYAILTDSSLWGWGGNANGTIGDGNENNYYTYKCCPGPNSGSPAPFAWGQDFHDVQVFKPKRIGQGIKFKSIWVTNALDYTGYFLDQYNILYAAGRDKQAICHGITPGNVTQGDQQGHYPNSWDHPYLTKIFPFRVTTVYQSPSPYCVLNPASTFCSHYTIPSHSAPTAVYSASTAGGYIVLNASGSSDTRVIAYSIHKQTAGTPLAMGAPDQPIDTIKMTTTGTAIPNGSYSFQVTLINDNWDSTKATATVTVGGSNCQCSYFFAASGSDANPGTIGSPFQTLTKLNSLASDTSASFFLNGGDTWYGGITGFKGKRLDSYGTGQAIVSGFITLSSWMNEGGGIYSASCPGCSIKNNLLTINGAQQPIARDPDTGYYSFETSSGHVSITDNQLAGSPDHSSGYVVIRNNHFTETTNKITSISGTTINYTSVTTQAANPGYGYFFFNDSLSLTVFGEWWLSAASGRMKVFFGGGGPGTNVVKTTSVDTLLRIADGAKGVTINNIDFEGAGIMAVYIGVDTNTTVSNCTMRYNGGSGILDDLSIGTRLVSNYIDQSNDNAILIQPTVKNNYTGYNTVKNSGLLPGHGRNVPGFSYTGIRQSSVGGITEFNRMDSVGYDGIYGYQDSSINNNWVTNALLVLDDGAGIYHLGFKADSTKRNIIRHNIVTDIPGNVQGTADLFNQSFCIYSDNTNVNQIIDSNVCARSAYAGVFLHNTRTTWVLDNTIYDCPSGIDMQGDNPANPMTNLIVKRNIIGLTAGANRFVVNVSSFNGYSYFNLPSFDSNYYSYPRTNATPFRTFVTSTATLKNYAQWQGVATDTRARQLDPALLFQYNTTSAPVQFALTANYVNALNTPFYTSTAIPAFAGLLLFQGNYFRIRRNSKIRFQ